MTTFISENYSIIYSNNITIIETSEQTQQSVIIDLINNFNDKYKDLCIEYSNNKPF